MKRWVLAVAALSFSSLVLNVRLSAQRPSPPGLNQANQAVIQGERNVPPPLEQRPANDLSKLKRDAEELAALAQSIPAGVDQETKGVLQKDLGDRLKRIEKLAKELRSQISK